MSTVFCKNSRSAALLFHRLSILARCLLFFPPFRLQPTVDAAAEVLPIEVILSGQHDRTLIAALFLEVRRQPRDAILLRQFRSSGVNKHRVFMRADGQRGADKIR